MENTLYLNGYSELCITNDKQIQKDYIEVSQKIEHQHIDRDKVQSFSFSVYGKVDGHGKQNCRVMLGRYGVQSLKVAQLFIIIDYYLKILVIIYQTCNAWGDC